MRQLRSTCKGLMVTVLTVISLILCGMWEGVPAEDTMPPTIAELTEGKVKIGDLVTKENVELVKEYLPVHVYELVKQGMVMEMGENIAPWATVPKFFQEVTRQNHEQYGKPVIDENAVIYTKGGEPWPGGTPFPQPTNGLEVAANIKYERALDDFCSSGSEQLFVNKEGKAYKSQIGFAVQVAIKERLTIPPLGSVPGMEKELYRQLIGFTGPLELKGLGQVQIKYWDDVKDPDKGFAYIPAFKRVIRISATTYQDNMGGSDMTWGDPGGGYVEPFSYWQFKLAGQKNMLVQHPFGPDSTIHPDGTIEINLPWDEGKRFPRDEWVVMPLYILEATPKIKHVYGKRVFYVPTQPYSNCWINIMATDYYDRQFKLWKGWNMTKRTTYIRDQPFSLFKSQHMHDLQTRHQSHQIISVSPNCGGQPSTITLKALIAKGR